MTKSVKRKRHRMAEALQASKPDSLGCGHQQRWKRGACGCLLPHSRLQGRDILYAACCTCMVEDCICLIMLITFMHSYTLTFSAL